MNRKPTLSRVLFSALFFCMLIPAGSRAQTNVEVFGQNRVQYRRFDWKYFEAKHFKIYHYDRAGQDLARYVAEQAEQDVTAVENRLGGSFPNYLNIIIYNTYDDYQQSNIGYKTGGQIENNPAGTVNILGDKLVIYFTGNHADLKLQLRRGIAKVVMERLLFGENIREMVRNSVLLNLPVWASDGYVDYVVEGWTSEADNEWKNIVSDTTKKIFFDEIAQRKPQLAGRAFWKYIADRYGENSVKSVLYLTQLKSSLNTALKTSFNQKEREVYDSVIAYYQNIYHFQHQLFDHPDTSRMLYAIPAPKDESTVRDILVSPRGFDIAYVKWRFGEYNVMLQRTGAENAKDRNSTASLLHGGVLDHRADDDPDYPLISWSNTGFKLGIIYNFKNRIRIKIYDAVKGKMARYTVPKNRFDRVLSFTFMEDDDVLLISAIRKGQSDLFEYRMKRGRMEQLTDDTWDDLQPVFVTGGSRKGVVFLSNRTEPYMNIKPLPNELPGGQMNAFFYNATTRSTELLQLSHLNSGNISQVIPYGFDNFAFLSDMTGVSNRYAILFGRTDKNMDSAYAVPVTNYEQSILYQQYNPASQKIAEVVQYPDRYAIYFRNVELPPPAGGFEIRNPIILPHIDALSDNKSKILFFDSRTYEQQYGKKGKKKGVEEEGKWQDVRSGDAFQSEFASQHTNDSVSKESQQFAQKLSIKTPEDSLVVIQSSSDIQMLDSVPQYLSNKKVMYVDSSFLQMRPQVYRSAFRLDFVSARLDNAVLFNRYQSYTGNGGAVSNPPLGGMFTMSLVDKMEDYRFTGGFRVPLDFSTITYLVQFQNLRRRTDWGLTFLKNDTRKEYQFLINTGGGQGVVTELGKTKLSLLQGDVSYPFDRVKSVRMALGFREDQMIIKASDPIGLALPTVKEYWALSRVEFVYDDTRNPEMNIYNGTRFKIFGEYMYKMFGNNNYYQPAGGFDSTKLGGFFNAGFDYRNYRKIYKNFIGAVRVAGAHSAGNKQIKYMLGGVDNPLRPESSNALQPSDKNTYAFQALETNLRGYPQNARNGNTFLTLNAEMRLPIFGTFVRRPINFAPLRYLQAVAFVDVGSAWEGLLPMDDRQRLQNLYWPDPFNPTITVNIPVTTYGLGVGYGFGLRTMLFGYFIRADAAWNIEKDFRLHVSLGMDF